MCYPSLLHPSQEVLPSDPLPACRYVQGVMAKNLGTVGEDEVVDPAPSRELLQPGPSHEPALEHQEEKSQAPRSPNASAAKGKERDRLLRPEPEDARQRRANVAEPVQAGTAGHHRRISSAARGKPSNGARKGRRDGITLALLRQMAAKPLALKVGSAGVVALGVELVSRGGQRAPSADGSGGAVGGLLGGGGGGSFPLPITASLDASHEALASSLHSVLSRPRSGEAS